MGARTHGADLRVETDGSGAGRSTIVLTRDPARAGEKLVGHWGAVLDPAFGDLLAALPPNRTPIVDLVLTRVVRDSVFRFSRSLSKRSFRDDEPGGAF